MFRFKVFVIYIDIFVCVFVHTYTRIFAVNIIIRISLIISEFCQWMLNNK